MQFPNCDTKNDYDTFSYPHLNFSPYNYKASSNYVNFEIHYLFHALC